MQAEAEINSNVKFMLGSFCSYCKITKYPISAASHPQPTDVALVAGAEPGEEQTDIWQSTRKFLKYLRTSLESSFACLLSLCF